MLVVRYTLHYRFLLPRTSSLFSLGYNVSKSAHRPFPIFFSILMTCCPSLSLPAYIIFSSFIINSLAHYKRTYRFRYIHPLHTLLLNEPYLNCFIFWPFIDISLCVQRRVRVLSLLSLPAYLR